MIALNATLGALWMSRNLSLTDTLLSLTMIGGFQAFAALTGHYAGSRERAREHLARVNAELLATRCLLEESARSGERLKLSRELHDVAGHSLTALKLNLARLARDPALAEREEVRVSSALADELLGQIRQVVGALRAHDGLDLRAALAALALPLPGTRIEIDVEEGLRVDDLDRAEALLRCAQEAITNAVRHGRAARIDVRLRRRDDALELTVANDGASPARIAPGNGLTGMRERLAAVGGILTLEPTPPRGLRLVARIPTDAETEAPP
jgi:signal transduction histidine kinase